MLTKTITYTDFNGVSRTENFLFNLTNAEIMEMEMSIDGGLAEKIKKVTEAQSMPELIKIFKDLILRAYGEKSDDGRRFIKERNGEPLSIAFSQTEAYSKLFIELATDAEKAAEFVNGIVPSEAAVNLNAQTAEKAAIMMNQ